MGSCCDCCWNWQGLSPQASGVWTEALTCTLPREVEVLLGCEALHGVKSTSLDLICCMSLPPRLYSSHAGLLAAPQAQTYQSPPASGPLHMLCPVPFPVMSVWLLPPPPSRLCSNVTFSEKLPLTPTYKTAPRSWPSLAPFILGVSLHGAHHHPTCYVIIYLLLCCTLPPEASSLGMGLCFILCSILRA